MADIATTQSKFITAGQIGQIQDRLGTKLRESRLDANAVQQLLTEPAGALYEDMLAVLQRRVDAISNMIVRRAKVNRARSPGAAISATDRIKYLDDKVVKTMPKGEGEDVDVYFFKVGKYLPASEVAKEYELRGLVPDPYAQAAVNEDDPAFADEHPNSSQWDKNRCLTFHRWRGRREVDCDEGDDVWDVYWWFAGVRK